MKTDSASAMITALRSCGLESMRLQRAAGGAAIELSPSAAKYLGCAEKLTLAELSGPGSEPEDSSAPRLGAWLATRLSAETESPPVEAAQGNDGEWLLCVDSGDSIELFRKSPAITDIDRRELRHRFRNHLNTIVMNTELISMLANQAGNADIARAAVRIEEEIRACISSLDSL